MLTVYLGVLGGAGLLALSDPAPGSSPLAGTAVLRVPAETSAARLSTALALLRQTRGIAEAKLTEPPESARLVTAWLDSSRDAEPVPMPRRIDLRVAGGHAGDIADLRRKLAQVVPDGELDDGGLRPIGGGFGTVSAVGALTAMLVFVILPTAVTAAAFVGRGWRTDRNRAELLLLLGAHDDQIARPYQTEALRLAAISGTGAALAAALTLLALGRAQTPLPVSISGAAFLDWRVWLIGAGFAAAAAATAALAARVAALRRLDRTW
jgi:cell division transport system permease protein